MKTSVTFHFCLSFFVVNNYCKSAKHPWHISESLVGVYLSFLKWNLLKTQVVFWLQKDSWPFFFFFFPRYTNQLRQADGVIMELSDFTFLSVVLISSFISICLFIFPTCYEIYLCHFMCWNLPEPFHKYDSRWQAAFPLLMPRYLIAAVHAILVAWSPESIDFWLTFPLKANHAINTVMFYFHSNKGHKETRHFRALTPPPPLLAPCTASSHYRLFSKSR